MKRNANRRVEWKTGVNFKLKFEFSFSLNLSIVVCLVYWISNYVILAGADSPLLGVPGSPGAINITESTITLSWDPPTDGSPLVHNFRIQSKILGTDSEWESSLYLTDNNSTVFKVEGLLPGTVYVYRVAANYENGAEGPWSEETRAIVTSAEWPPVNVSVLVLEGAPEKLKNVRLLSRSDNTVTILWSPCAQAHGKLLGYVIYYQFRKTTAKRFASVDSAGQSFTLDNLEPYTAFKIKVAAYNSAAEGEMSNTVSVTTDTRGPSAPDILDARCTTSDSIEILWRRPTQVYKTLDYYYLKFWPKGTADFLEMELEGGSKLNRSSLLTNLMTNKTYEIQITGATRSIVDPQVIKRGKASRSVSIFVGHHCGIPSDTKSNKLNIWAIIIPPIVGCIILRGLWVYWRWPAGLEADGDGDSVYLPALPLPIYVIERHDDNENPVAGQPEMDTSFVGDCSRDAVAGPSTSRSQEQL